MTIDEVINRYEKVAKDMRNIDEGELGLIYCDDTDCIEKHKNRCVKCANEYEQLAEWLKDYKRLIEQEPKTKWIPVSERLPDEKGWYECTADVNNGQYLVLDLYFTKDKKWRDNRRLDTASTYEMYGYGLLAYKHKLNVNEIDGIDWTDNVVAWMSLPEPYKGCAKDGISIVQPNLKELEKDVRNGNKMRVATPEENQSISEYYDSISERVYTRDELLSMCDKIELLEKELCEDCISRQYLKDCIYEETHYTGHDILSLLETLPSIKPKPKTGRWHKSEKNKHGYYHFHCSECNGELQTKNKDFYEPYCYMCGAKMKR